MLEKAIEEISGVDLVALVENQVGERRTLEFKRDLPENGADPAKEFFSSGDSILSCGVPTPPPQRIFPPRLCVSA